MKTKEAIRIGILGGFLFIQCTMVFSQARQKFAVISMDTKGVAYDNAAMTSLVHLELEKINKFEVLDKYDVSDILKSNNIINDACMGKSCQVRVGKLLNSDKMVSGSVEKFGQKVIVVLRLIDVETGTIEKTDVMEYINQLEDIQIMVQLSLNNLLGISSDNKMKELLVYYAQPISSPKTTVNLNGPRMGAAYVTGHAGERLSAPKDQGGYNMHPVMMMFGYQHEVQYLSAGYFQALLEMIVAVNGLESGLFSPSLTAMNGFRFNKVGWEFGVGPIVRVVKMANGIYDQNGNWVIEQDLDYTQQYDLLERVDRRGKVTLTTGMLVAVGKTFSSGYLNIPVNLYFSPRKEGSVIGLSFGFNVAKTTRPVIKSN
jgi:TolB-like protein